MKLTIAVAAYGQLYDTKVFWGNLVGLTSKKEEVELLVINNSPEIEKPYGGDTSATDNTQMFLEKWILPHFPDHKVISNPENVGVVKSLDMMHRNASGDVIAILHNDTIVMQANWNEWILSQFENDPKLGLAGFLGSVGTAHNGGRHITMSNLLEAEAHGQRITEVTDCVGFDGLALIPRKAMLDEVGGFDLNYDPHHFYDRDISLTSYHAGWKNKVIPVYCHHISGVTANRGDFANWSAKHLNVAVGEGDKTAYLNSEQYFLNKWQHYLPRMIGNPNEPQECEVHKIPVK